MSISKFLSLVLRHQPEVIGLQLDEEGWVEVDAFLVASKQHGKEITLEVLHEVVASNDKKRFALSEDGLRIRASQGHSVSNVNLKLAAETPPETLYHGTVSAFLESIRSSGLEKRSRNHVHLSPDEATAIKVGSRRGKAVVLRVDAAAMHADGHCFFRSANGVWLVDAVPVKYLQFPREAR